MPHPIGIGFLFGSLQEGTEPQRRPQHSSGPSILLDPDRAPNSGDLRPEWGEAQANMGVF